MNWIILSVFSAFCLAALTLLTKGILSKGVVPEVLNFWLFATSSIGFGFLAYFRGLCFQVPHSTVYLFVALLVVVLGYNDFLVRAFAEAPNPGYVQGVVSLSMILVLILSVFFFGSALTFSKVVGMVLVLAGIFILCFWN